MAGECTRWRGRMGHAALHRAHERLGDGGGSQRGSTARRLRRFRERRAQAMEVRAGVPRRKSGRAARRNTHAVQAGILSAPSEARNRPLWRLAVLRSAAHIVYVLIWMDGTA